MASNVGTSSSGTSPPRAAADNCSNRVRADGSGIARAKAAASVASTSASAGSTFNVSLPCGSDQDLQLVLETTGFDGAMHAALFRAVFFPPPAARPGIRAGLHGAGARGAADALVALVVERVVRDAVVADVVPHLFVGPVGQRVDFDDAAVVVVQLDLADVRARRPL